MNDTPMFFVKNGQMENGLIIGYMDIQVVAGKTFDSFSTSSVASSILSNGDWNEKYDMPVMFDEIVNRPGRWLYLTGNVVIHLDDTHDTAEDAAESYKKYLLGVS
jgi:hypothetical protein